MYAEDSERVAIGRRASSLLNRIEGVYLRVLRAAILVIATLLLLYAAWLALSSLYKLSRSPESVQEEQVAVAADEITNAEIPRTVSSTEGDKRPTTNTQHATYYRDFVRRYYNLYRTSFEPYRQQEDKQLALGEFDDSFVNTAERMKAAASGELNFDDDRTDLETLFSVMKDAAGKPLTKQRLSKYQSAKKVAVKKKTERTRTEYRQGWDSSSTACSNWYEDPVGCSARRAIEIPYTETVTVMEYPAGTQSHTQIFKAFQDRYLQLLQERRDASAAKAENERQGILAGFVDGHISLMTALQLLGAFMVLMFFFLLIAIERHQRRLAAEAPTQVAEE